jgi:hypothetical protein
MNILEQPAMIQQRARDRSPPAADVAPPRAAVAAPARPREDWRGRQRRTARDALQLEYFEGLRTTWHMRQHSAALKYLRYRAEESGDAEVLCEDTMHIGRIQKPAKIKGKHNMDFWFKRGEWDEWSWHEMIAHMTPETRAVVVNGMEGSSGGLLECVVSSRPQSYSHPRCYAARNGQQSLGPAAGEHKGDYDFVVYRADGTAIRFHPEWSKKKFAMYELVPHEEQVPAPRRGPGMSWGSGTYAHYKVLDKLRDGEFDSQKGCYMPPPREGYP